MSSMDLNEMVFYWKNFRIEDLRNDLDIYLKQIDYQKSIENDLTNRFNQFQNIIRSDSINNLNKSLLIDSFSSQLNNLTNRLRITENLVVNLVKFFSNIVNRVNEAEDDEEDEEESFESENDSFKTENSANKYPYDLNNAPLPDESTEEIAKKLKEYMQITKISQRLFAESLLNMKQANFSFLLSHPLTWSELSKTYRDRFLIMHLWLNDPDRMNKLVVEPKVKIQKNVTSKYSFASAFNSENRKRIKLKYSQIDQLKAYFEKNQYPSSTEISQISSQLNLPYKKISTWFTHQRQINKFKK